MTVERVETEKSGRRYVPCEFCGLPFHRPPDRRPRFCCSDHRRRAASGNENDQLLPDEFPLITEHLTVWLDHDLYEATKEFAGEGSMSELVRIALRMLLHHSERCEQPEKRSTCSINVTRSGVVKATDVPWGAPALQWVSQAYVEKHPEWLDEPVVVHGHDDDQDRSGEWWVDEYPEVILS